jgi:hypothetical protein
MRLVIAVGPGSSINMAFCSLSGGDGENQESVKQQVMGVADDRGAAPEPR